MKKILITGVNSYVGTSLGTWLENFPERYKTEYISLKNDLWKEINFSIYDVVVHVAGIAHRKETKENTDLYYCVNRDIANEVAIKSKKDGVGQFIFLSSMSVYGVETGVITKNTPLKPKSNYGKSKLQAEELIRRLKDDSFKVAILRPPMIYGKKCKGNYTRLASIALRTPFFPEIDNKRSMIYIDNLSEFIKSLIDDSRGGLFLPQNQDYVKTTDMVKLIAETHGKKIRTTKLFNPILKVLKNSTSNKVFGDLIYEKSLSNTESYKQISLKESVQKTET